MLFTRSCNNRECSTAASASFRLTSTSFSKFQFSFFNWIATRIQSPLCNRHITCKIALRLSYLFTFSELSIQLGLQTCLAFADAVD